MKFLGRDIQFEVRNTSTFDMAACLIILVFLVSLTWFGAEFHYVELCYSAEYDRYVEKADQLRQGILPSDHYHGIFYPLLAAAVGTLMGGTFAGARTISTLAAGGLLSFTYLIGARCFSRKVALLGTTAMALNSLVVLCGFEAATDMLFSFLGLSCLLLSIDLLERPSTLRVIGLGVCFSLAFFTRYTAVAILPCLLLALWICPLPSKQGRLGGALTFAVTVLVCLLPHFALNTYKFGGPFVTRAADSLTTKLFLHLSGASVSNSDMLGMTGLVMNHPILVGTSAAMSAKEWLIDGLAGFVAGNRVYLASALFTVTLLGGLVGSVMRADKRVSLLLTYVAGHFMVLCVFLVTLPRFFLPVLPLCMLIAVRFMTEEPPAEGILSRRMLIARRTLAVAVFLTLLPVGAYYAVSDMLARHPYRELAAAKELEMTAGRNIVVAGSFPFLQRYVGYRYHHLGSDYGNKDPQERVDYFRRLRPELKQNGVDYVVVGFPSLGSRPKEWLTGQNLPDYLHRERLEGDLAVYRVRKDRL